MDGIEEGTGALDYNAEIISHQTRKYHYQAVHNLLAVFDGNSLVGQKHRNTLEEFGRLRGNEIVDLQIFWVGNSRHFLSALLHLADIAMAQIYSA